MFLHGDINVLIFLAIYYQNLKQLDPQQKYRLGTISNTKLVAGLNLF